MEFRLIYQGPLPGEGRGSGSHVKVKHAIRRKMHEQLRDLWSAHPFIAKYYAPTETRNDAQKFASVAERIGHDYRRCGYHFVPLIGAAFGRRSETACALDILFLRRDTPGRVVREGGDIDNRIKTLLDSLQIPDSCAHIPEPSEDENPFFCLLEDDSLITELSITTDQLLTPRATEDHENDVLLIIRVKTLAIGAGFADIGTPPPFDVSPDGKKVTI